MIRYPQAFDGNDNLHEVHDCLKAKLSQDYNPGDKVVYTEDNIEKFPDTGIISLVSQCTEEKIVNLRYTRKGEGFFEIEGAVDFKDSFKPKDETLITQQVMAEHHNAIKDAILNIEKYMGTVRDKPADSSIYGRLNLLTQIVFQPRAWFSASVTQGIAPLNVTFTSESVTAVGRLLYTWDFGDGTYDESRDGTVLKTYSTPGTYTVTLTVSNQFGSDKIFFKDMIKVRNEAPKEANIDFIPQNGQAIMEDGRIRTPVSQFVVIEIQEGENPENPGFSNGGEAIDPMNGKKYDQIVSYTWDLEDDLPHENSPQTKAIYSIGGLNDILLRVDTLHGAYRITRKPAMIDVVEPVNLWLWTINDNSVTSHEFGLFSETFKSNNSTYKIDVQSGFLSGKAKQEFLRNNGVVKKGNLNSGSQGHALIYWASGRRTDQSSLHEKVNFLEYRPFTDTYIHQNGFDRPWNWVAFANPSKIYFMFGNQNEDQMPSLSMTNQSKIGLDLTDLSISNQIMNREDYQNGAHELMQNSVEFNSEGKPLEGHFSKNRTTWCQGVGYLLRSSKSGNLKNFYCTEGTIGNPFMSINKLADLPGSGKEEGQITTLNNSIYLFNNSGTVMSYSKYSGAWETVGPISEFKISQDLKSKGHDDAEGTLLIASDNNRRAYLSFDYSSDAFIKFNEIDMTFTNVNSRPHGKQWLMSIF